MQRSADPEQLDGALEKTARECARAILDDGRIPAWRADFQLAQALKGVPGADAEFRKNRDFLLPALRAFCEELHARPQNRFDGYDFSENGVEDLWFRVVAAWEKVRVAGGALGTAVHQADYEPVVLRSELADGKPLLRMMASIAYHLQVLMKDKPIFLPQKALAKLLGKHHTTVGAVTRELCRCGLLQVVDQSFSHPRRMAKTYQFNIDSALYRPFAARDRQNSTDLPPKSAVVSVATAQEVFPGSRVVSLETQSEQIDLLAADGLESARSRAGRARTR